MALVDAEMLADKLVNSVAKRFGVRWASVKAAVETRIKIDDEEGTHQHGIWTQQPRSTRCDMHGHRRSNPRVSLTLECAHVRTPSSLLSQVRIARVL